MASVREMGLWAPCGSRIEEWEHHNPHVRDLTASHERKSHQSDTVMGTWQGHAAEVGRGLILQAGLQLSL